MNEIDRILEVERESMSSNVSSILSKYKHEHDDLMNIDKGKSMQLDHIIKSIGANQSISISNHTQARPFSSTHIKPFTST